MLRRHKVAPPPGVVFKPPAPLWIYETLCGNHSAVAGRRMLTLEELRAECFPPGDRRARDRRLADRRTPAERRADRVSLENVHRLLEPEKRAEGRGRRR
jgi:hypothetical protein